MVLENLYPIRLIEKDPLFALLLGFGYSIIGIGLSIILFPEDPALISIAFISLMIYPTINKMLRQEEEIESQSERFSLVNFFREHKAIFWVYILLFLGILLAFSFFSLMLPSLATNHLFENQINVMYQTPTGKAFDVRLFANLFSNNLSVLLLCFVAALIIGDGAIFLITWNASVWGTIFGNLAKTSALNVAQSPIGYFFIVLAIVFPHMILEAFSYLCSATAGGVVSKGLMREKFFSERFREIIKNTMILLMFGLIVLIIAVSIETLVLEHASIYRTIIKQSFM